MQKSITITTADDDQDVLVWKFLVDGKIVATGRETAGFETALFKARQARKEYREKELAETLGTSQSSVEGN